MEESTRGGLIAVCILLMIASCQCDAAGGRRQVGLPEGVGVGATSSPGVAASTAVGQSGDQQAAFIEVSRNLTASVDRLSTLMLVLSSTLNQSIGTSLVREMST
jgi:hypothetical protein